MNFISNFIKGLALGIGAIAPGVSGGALAVIFGIYDKLTNIIANIFKDFKSNLLFIFPIGLGSAAGVIIFSRVIEYLFSNYHTEVSYLFIGLMVGTFPMLFKQANKQGFKTKYIVPFITTLVITVIFSVLNNSTTNIATVGTPTLIAYITYGAVIGFGTIIPGISASFILMYLGSYEKLLSAISNFDLAVLIPVGLGFILTIVLFAKLMAFLFKKIYGYTYYAVMGLVVGSILPIFPGITFNFRYLFSILIFSIGFYLSFSLSKHTKDN